MKNEVAIEVGNNNYSIDLCVSEVTNTQILWGVVTRSNIFDNKISTNN